MVYHVIGTMSGSSMDGLDIAYCILEEVGGKWSYQIPHATCVAFDTEWKEKLTRLTTMPAKELLLAHTAFGHWMGTGFGRVYECTSVASQDPSYS
jgi:anhydro-N-acetylmuramic acid kinase